MDRAETLAWLDGLGINYRLATHPAVHTIQAMEELAEAGLIVRDGKRIEVIL